MQISRSLASLMGLSLSFIALIPSLSQAQVQAQSNIEALTPSSRIEQGHEALNDLHTQGFAGSVLLTCGDEIFLERDIGITPPPDHTLRYEVASISKWITALGILRLVDQGHLDLSDTLDQYFPTLEGEHADITLFHLLTHQSGLPQSYSAEGHWTPESAATAILSQDLAFSPGSDFTYSNDNFSLLAIIIDQVSTSDYTTFLHQELSAPLGLDPIAFWPTPPRNLEVFPPFLNPRAPRSHDLDWGFLGGHGARLSMRDLHTLLINVENGQVLSPDSLARMHGPYLTRPSGLGIGMGWYTQTDAQGHSLAFTFGYDDAGSNAIAYTVDDKGLTIIAASHNGPVEDGVSPWSRQVRDAMIDIFAANGDHPDICARQSPQ